MKTFNEIDYSIRIGVGTEAAVGQFPYVASLQDKYYGHICTVTIIRSRWLITAAQCTIGRTKGLLRVRVGSNVQNGGGTLLEIEQTRIHKDFNPLTRTNDISTLKTVQTIAFNQYVRPIALTTLYYGSRAAIVSGWGLSSVYLKKYSLGNDQKIIIFFSVTIWSIEYSSTYLYIYFNY